TRQSGRMPRYRDHHKDDSMGLLEKLCIYLIVAGVFVLIGGGVYGRYEYIVRQNVALKEQTRQATEVAAANKEEFDKLNQRFDALDKIMAERAKREQRTATALNGIRKDLNDLKQQDPVVKTWSDQPVPDAISQRLRSGPPNQG